MTQWIRFKRNDEVEFGALSGSTISVHSGQMFDGPSATGDLVDLAQVEVLTPCLPGKFIALWNNFHALAAKLEQAIPAEPLYFLKPNSSYLAHGRAIRRPVAYSGRVAYEGELGIVIGKECASADEGAAAAAIFGFTCVNDITALDELSRDPSFPQWTRAKGHDTFGVFGPVIATGLDPRSLTVQTFVGERERQNYSCADMVFTPAEIVRLISRDMTLRPGDVIACGTSLGVGPLRAGSEVRVVIDGIGSLANTFE